MMLKKVFLLLLAGIVFPVSVNAASDLPQTEAQIMGTLAGAAWACGADKSLRNFEVISGNILLNKARTKKGQELAIEQYAEAKLNGYRAQKRLPKVKCDLVLERFEKQDIFNSTVMSDGSVKLPDGTWLYPPDKASGSY